MNIVNFDSKNSIKKNGYISRNGEKKYNNIFFPHFYLIFYSQNELDFYLDLFFSNRCKKLLLKYETFLQYQRKCFDWNDFNYFILRE